MSRYVDDVVGNFITYALQSYPKLRLTRCRSFRGLVNVVFKYDDYPVLFEAEVEFNDDGKVEYVTVNGGEAHLGHDSLLVELATFVEVANGTTRLFIELWGTKL